MTFATAGFGCEAFYLFAQAGGWQVPRSHSQQPVRVQDMQ